MRHAIPNLCGCGSSTSIAELKGKLILLEFFATW